MEPFSGCDNAGIERSAPFLHVWYYALFWKVLSGFQNHSGRLAVYLLDQLCPSLFGWISSKRAGINLFRKTYDTSVHEISRYIERDKKKSVFSSWMRFTVKRILLTVKRHISRCQSGSRIIRAYRQQRMVERCQPISPYFLSVCSCRSRWIPHISHMPRVGLHFWCGAHKPSKRKRIVDFNQGIDSRLITEANI